MKLCFFVRQSASCRIANASRSECPLLARTGPPAMSAVRSLSGEKRTSRGHPISVAIDPSRHYWHVCFRAALGVKRTRSTYEYRPNQRCKDSAIFHVSRPLFGWRRRSLPGEILGQNLPVRTFLHQHPHPVARDRFTRLQIRVFAVTRAKSAARQEHLP